MTDEWNDHHPGTAEARATYWHGRAEAAWAREDKAGNDMLSQHHEIMELKAQVKKLTEERDQAVAAFLQMYHTAGDLIMRLQVTNVST